MIQLSDWLKAGSSNFAGLQKPKDPKGLGVKHKCRSELCCASHATYPRKFGCNKKKKMSYRLKDAIEKNALTVIDWNGKNAAITGTRTLSYKENYSVNLRYAKI